MATVEITIEMPIPIGYDVEAYAEHVGRIKLSTLTNRNSIHPWGQARITGSRLVTTDSESESEPEERTLPDWRGLL